jgi:HSP90 family molecular chaperone
MTGEMVSLDEYVSRCPPEQKDIYYLYAPTRELALQSPYMEVFSKNKREVLFIYSPIDDFVMTSKSFASSIGILNQRTKSAYHIM